jgi:hypothetical protein
MDDDQVDDCGESAQIDERSWVGLKDSTLATRFRSASTEAPMAPVLSVAYDDPGEKYAPIAELMKERKLLESVASTLSARFPLKRPATIRATICDDDDAYYDNESNEIQLCYEYVQFYYDLIADPEHAGDGMI